MSSGVGCSLLAEEADTSGERLLGLFDHLNATKVAIVDQLAAWDAVNAWRDDGDYSPVGWIAARTPFSRTQARDLVNLARNLRDMPHVSEAVHESRLSVDQAVVISRTVNFRTRAAFAEQEAFMVETLEGLRLDETRVVIAKWDAMVDPDGHDPGDPIRNFVHLNTTFDGRWRLDAELDAESGAVVKAVLEKIVDKLFHEDKGEAINISHSCRRAEALVEMAHRATAAGDNQTSLTPDIVVIVEPDDQGEPAKVEMNGHPVPVEIFRRLCCDATIARLVVDADSEPLDLGRSVRTATWPQRKAVIARDRHCVFPGCDVPATWCQVHHIEEWDLDHGPTDLNNLCLLCRFHHRYLHRQRWKIKREPDNTWVVDRGNGIYFGKPDCRLKQAN